MQRRSHTNLLNYINRLVSVRIKCIIFSHMDNVSSISATARSGQRFASGRLAIDYANAAHISGESGEVLSGWADLILFLAEAGNVSHERATTLLELPATAPEETAALFESALDLRDALSRSVRARAEGTVIRPAWIAKLNSILACTEGYERLEPRDAKVSRDPEWELRLAARSDGLEWLLAAIARSAAELIAEGPAAPIRKCANPKCGFYFYDESRTRRRRWCSMKTCGNRAKVAAHARRKRSSEVS